MKGRTNIKNSCALILAAGLSSRMKVPKPFLAFDDRKMFIEKIIDEYYNFGIENIVVTVNGQSNNWRNIFTKYKNNRAVTFVKNPHPEYERFYSIKCGIGYLGENIEYCFLQNTDNPFIDTKLLEAIYNGRFLSGYTVPVYNEKGGHPIILGHNVIEHLIKSQRFDLNFKDFLAQFERKNVIVNSNVIHININTQDDYDKIFTNSLIK